MAVGATLVFMPRTRADDANARAVVALMQQPGGSGCALVVLPAC